MNVDITGMHRRNVEPLAFLIKGLRNDKLGFNGAIAEIVDNSMDAGGTEVTIDTDGEQQTIAIRDNGQGCRSVVTMARLGAHERRDTGRTTSGRFGQGLTAAAIWLAYQLQIETIYRHTLLKAFADWEVMEEEDHWSMWESTPDVVEQSSGTLIRLLKVFRPLDSARLKSLRDYLSQLFTPGIARGVRILVNGVPVPQLEFPVLQNVIEVKENIGGKLFNLRAGKMQEANSKLAGLWFRHGHRFISRNNFNACGDMPSYHFHGIVDLIDGTEEWQLERNKDGFHEADDLNPILFEHLSVLLELLEEEGTRYQIKDMCEAIEHLFEGGFPGVVKGFVHRKKTADKSGTKTSSAKGGSHGNRGGDPNEKGPHSVFSTRSGMTLKVRMQGLEDAENMYSIIRSPHMCQVTYNSSNQTVQEFRNDSRLLYVLAVAGFVNELTEEENAKLGFDGLHPSQRYIKALSLALRGLSGETIIERKRRVRRGQAAKHAVTANVAN